MGKWETIVKIAGEGGSIGLLGQKSEGEDWVYKKEINEIKYEDSFEEDTKPADEVIKVKSTIHRKNDIAHDWPEALEILDTYPWTRLVPITVHPEFRIKVWKEIIKEVNTDYIPNRWMRKCFPKNNELAKLSLWIKKSRFTVVLTGAGMSTESGIPDFRSKDGWWKNIDPTTVASTEALHKDYDLFHEFYSIRLKGLEKCEPHMGHKILADWEKKGLIHSIATQNVDGLHIKAGSATVYELHGSIDTVRCDSCGATYSKIDFLEKRLCLECRGKLRPNVVLFGEALPQESWNKALSDILKAELVIVIGSSLQVSPVNILPSIAKGRVVYINNEIESNIKFDLSIRGKAKVVLTELEEILV